MVERNINNNISYSVAYLDDIPLYCKHYNNFKEVEEAWNRRKARINWDNVYLIMTDRDFIPPITHNKMITACEEEVIKKFEQLEFKNKICIVKNKAWGTKYKSCRCLIKFYDSECVGIITNVVGIMGKRMYQYVKDFDYIKFLNDGA